MSQPRSRRRDLSTVVRVLLVTLVFVTPGVFDLGAVKPFDIVKVSAVWFFAILALGVFAAAVMLRRARLRTFLMGWLALGYLLVATVATLLSQTKLTSFFGWYGRYGGLSTSIAYVAIFYVIACAYRDRPDRTHEVVYAMAAGAIVMTAYIWVQWLGIDPISWARPSGEAPGQPYFGTMGNANFAGGYLGLTAPWLYLAFQRARSRNARIAVVVVGLAELWAIWLTSARNGMLALAFGVAALLFIHRRRVPLVLKAGAAVLALAAVALAVIVVWHPGSDAPPEALRRVDVLRSETVRVRGYWWLSGLEMFADRPVLGWGPDTFVTEYPKYLPREAAGIGDAETADKPHNVFVEHLAHTGIVGFGLYVALLVVAFRRAFVRMRGAEPREGALLATLIALLAGYAGQAFFSIDVTAIGLIGWVTLGCIAAVADPVEREPALRAEPYRPATRTRALALAVIVVAAALAAVSTAPLKADHESRTARRLASDDAFIDEVVGHMELAKRWNAYVPQYYALEAEYLQSQARMSDDADEKRQLFDEAVENMRQTDRLQPGYHGWKMAIGKSLGELAAVGGASFDEAHRWIEDALALAPYDWRVHANRGDIHNLEATAKKDPDLLCRALEDYRAAAALYRPASPAWLGVGRTLARLGRLDQATKALRRAARTDRINDSPKPAERLIDEVRKLQQQKKPPPVVDCD